MHPFKYIKALDHHAYFIHSFKDAIPRLKDFLKKEFYIEHSQNPDFSHEKFETLGIEDSRRIKESHLAKSFVAGSKRIFIIETTNITHEAQNSFLKMFEEPHEDIHFFLIMPSVQTLLPTLRSRLSVVPDDGDNGFADELLNKAKEFLTLSKKDKVAFMDDLAKSISDEDLNKSDAQEFLAALELIIYKKEGIKNNGGLKAILKARDYLNDRSPSIKQLLEYVALSL